MSKKMIQQSFRLSESMVSDIDWLARVLAEPNGLEPNRTDGVRYAAHHARKTMLKLIGDIGAGPPQHVVADHDEYLRIHQLFPEGVVVYRVRGDSMRDECIADGDYVVVRPGQDAEHGATVVYHLADNGCVVKRYDKTKGMLFSGSGRGRWVHQLVPEDTLLGVCCGVIRKS